MSSASLLRLIATILFFMGTLTWIFLSPTQVNKSQDNDADRIARDLSRELQAHGSVSEVTVSSLPGDFFLALWYRQLKNDWQPVLYDKEQITEDKLTSPFILPEGLSTKRAGIEVSICRIYETETVNHKFIFWIYRFNSKYILELVLLPILVAMVVYLLFMIIVTMILDGNSTNDDGSLMMEDRYPDEMPAGDTLPKEQSRSDLELSDEKMPWVSHVDEYRDLWNRNFRISDRFRQSFPFGKMQNSVSFGTSPAQYIQSCLEIAGSWFTWSNPHIYLQQKDYIVDSISGETLDPAKITVPINGNARGQVFIPLFPYQSSELYGYLSFDWNKEEKFQVADILFFLKYLFSEKARFIFTSYKEHQNLIGTLKVKLSRHSETFIAFMEVDNRDRYLKSLKASWKISVSTMMKKRLKTGFKKMIVFEVSPFSFGIIGEKVAQKSVLHLLENNIGSQQLQHYEVSPEYGNIAITWSVGVAFQNNRDIHPLSLIGEANRFLKHALSSGGDQIAFDSNL
jgi:hypothetical protein